MEKEEQHQLEGAPAGPGKRKAPEPEGTPGEEQECEQEVGITGSSSASASAPASAASETRGEECQMIVSSSPEYSKSGGLVGRCCKVNAKCQRFQPSTAAADPKLCSTCGHHQSFHHAQPTPSLQQPKRRRTSAPIPASAIVLDLTRTRTPTPIRGPRCFYPFLVCCPQKMSPSQERPPHHQRQPKTRRLCCRLHHHPRPPTSRLPRHHRLRQVIASFLCSCCRR